MKKLKIFLGGYVNFPNAQNINCANIAKYLDKDKFEVHTMYMHTLSVDKAEFESAGVKLHCVWSRRFVWYWHRWLMMKLGNYDIYYLPKGESVDWEFAKNNPDKLFISSIEGVITATTNNTKEYKEYNTQVMSKCFAISNCIADSVKRFWDMVLPVLPLGVVESGNSFVQKDCIKTVAWVGNIKANKRPQYLVEIAKRFPQLAFYMLGDGDMMDSIMQRCKEEGITNITFTGRVPNNEVYKYMQKFDLFLMTSEFECLPKVIQEAAQCGLPAIYMNENYSVDFIEDGVNGYGVLSIAEMQTKIQYLLDNPAKFKEMSQNAYEIIQQYTWKSLIGKYEEFFIKAYKEKYGKR